MPHARRTLRSPPYRACLTSFLSFLRWVLVRRGGGFGLAHAVDAVQLPPPRALMSRCAPLDDDNLLMQDTEQVLDEEFGGVSLEARTI